MVQQRCSTFGRKRGPSRGVGILFFFCDQNLEESEQTQKRASINPTAKEKSKCNTPGIGEGLNRSKNQHFDSTNLESFPVP